MPDVDAIKSFLSSLSAVTRMHFQVWDAAPKLIFSTRGQAERASTATGHARLIKKIHLANAYGYASGDQGEFICGLPVALNQTDRGVLAAFGPLSRQASDGRHASRMKALLKQVSQIGGTSTPPRADTEAASAEQPGQRFEDLYLFANVSKQFRSLRLQQPVLDKLMQRMLHSMEVDAAFLYFPDHPDYNQLTIRPGLARKDEPSDALQEQLRLIVEGGTDRVPGNYCIIDNSKADDRLAALSDRPFRFMAVKIRHAKQCYGWLGLVSYALDTGFRQDTLTIVQTLANQLAALMANMHQYDDLERFTVNIVCSLVNAIESKDIFFRGHSKRVHQYVMQMANHLQLSTAQREALKWAAVLHDIGKIGIPETILCKPEKLTDKEFDLIKQHPLKGQAILAPIRQLQPSMEAIAHHHEKYDGSGYPEGRSGDAIPLLARVIAVADTFDAITSKRSYHKAKTPAQAFRIMDKLAGTQLDPQLVQVFKTACGHLLDAGLDREPANDDQTW